MDFKALLDISDFIIYQLNFFENGIITNARTQEARADAQRIKDNKPRFCP